MREREVEIRRTRSPLKQSTSAAAEARMGVRTGRKEKTMRGAESTRGEDVQGEMAFHTWIWLWLWLELRLRLLLWLSPVPRCILSDIHSVHSG